jgi:hypothetical protein
MIKKFAFLKITAILKKTYNQFWRSHWGLIIITLNLNKIYIFCHDKQFLLIHVFRFRSTILTLHIALKNALKVYK